MKRRIMVELAEGEGPVQLYEVSAGGSMTVQCSAAIFWAVGSGRENDPGRAATLLGPGAGRGAFPEPTSL